MNLEFFILGGYGQYVWSAFIFTFISCFALYLKTVKELRKQENFFFSEFNKMRTVEIEVDKQEGIVKETLSNSSAF